MVVSVKRAANAGYYFQGIAHLATLTWDRPGVWLAGDPALGVCEGQPVKLQELDRLLRRMTAHTAQSPTFGPSATLSGHDLVFSAPKAVSIVWALAPERREAIETAHQEAVKAAVDVLSREVIRERVGKGGRCLEPARAAIAAFLHTRCRPAFHPQTQSTFADPSLHTHVIVPDIVVSRTAKGRGYKVPYTTLYGRWAMALGAWYHAHLAYRLRACGYEPVSSGPNGVFTLEGIAQSWVAAFSARTKGVRELHRDLSVAESFERTRARHDRVSEEQQQRCWQDLATALQCKMPEPNEGIALPPDTPLADEVIEGVGVVLDEQSAVLQLSDLYRGLASYCVAKGLHLCPGPERVKDVTSHAAFREIEQSTSYGLPQWTTQRNWDLEESVRRAAADLQAAKFVPAPPIPAAGLFGNPVPLTLSQQRAVEELATDRQLVVLQGSPGTGKTSLLEPVIRSYQVALGKNRVIGLAEGWLQALQLKARFDIPCYSLAAFFKEVEYQKLRLDRPALLIVDEAGLLSTRRMDELLGVARTAPVKLIFLGDPQQLDPLGAGSGLRLVNGQAAVTLTELLRQKGPEAAAVVQEMAAIAAHRQKAHDGIDIAGQRRSVRDGLERLSEALVVGNHWQAYGSSDEAISTIADDLVRRRQDPSNVMGTRILVTSHREAHHVTRLVRDRLKKAGLIEESEIALAAVTPMGQTYRLKLACGDHVRFLVRCKNHDIYNGTEGEVRAIRPGADPELTVELFEGTPETVPGQSEAKRQTITVKASDLMSPAGRVQLACAYAMTIYGAQGSTFEDVTILKSARMSFRQLYVAVSRASQSFRIAEVSQDKQRGQGERDEKQLARLVAHDLLAMESRDRLKPLASEAGRLSNSARPDPAIWPWHVMVKGVIPAH